MSAPLPPRRPPPTFAPRFTLSLIYLFTFFFFYCLVMVAPALYEVAQSIPPGPEQEAAAAAAAKEAIQPRLLVAVLGSVLTVALGVWAKVLPGLKPQS